MSLSAASRDAGGALSNYRTGPGGLQKVQGVLSGQPLTAGAAVERLHYAARQTSVPVRFSPTARPASLELFMS
jgi:hypothetical protein